MNTTNNTESTIPTPPLSKTPVFPPLSIDGRGGATIATLTTVVIVLCAIVFCSPEDLWNAGWHVGYYGSILLWLAVFVFALSLFSAACPIVVGYSVKELVARAPSLLTISAPKQRELAPGLSIAPDDLIRFDGPEESPEQFAAKIKPGLHKKNRNYVFIFPRYTTDCVIVRKPSITGECTEVPATRNTLPWVKVDEWAQAPHDIENETWQEYEADLNRAVTGYRTWVAADKMTHAPEGSKALALAEALTRTVQVLLFVLLSAFTLNAQPKSVQVAQYVGPENFQKIKITGAVVFRFQKLPIERTAKAQTLAQILSDARTYSDEDNAGKLQEITLNGWPIPRNMQRAEVHAEVKEMPDTRTATRAEIAKFMRPAQRDTIAQAIPTATGFERMDSLTMAAKLEEGKRQFEGMKHEAGKVFQPVWKFLMYIFTSLLFLLIPAFFVLRYVSRTSAQEMMMTMWGRTITGRWMKSAHENSAAGLMLICWAVTIVFLLDSYVWLLYHDCEQWIIICIGIPTVWLAEVITNHIVPNVPTTDIVRR